MSSKYYKKLKDDTLWSVPDNLLEEDDKLEWILRYGSEENIIKKRMVIASVVHSYNALINKPQKRRNYICEGIKGGN